MLEVDMKLSLSKHLSKIGIPGSWIMTPQLGGSNHGNFEGFPLKNAVLGLVI